MDNSVHNFGEESQSALGAGVVRKYQRHPEVPAGEKWCSGCQKSKPADTEHFYRNKASRDGLTSYCKPCQILCQQKSDFRAGKRKLAPGVCAPQPGRPKKLLTPAQEAQLQRDREAFDRSKAERAEARRIEQQRVMREIEERRLARKRQKEEIVRQLEEQKAERRAAREQRKIEQEQACCTRVQRREARQNGTRVADAVPRPECVSDSPDAHLPSKVVQLPVGLRPVQKAATLWKAKNAPAICGWPTCTREISGVTWACHAHTFSLPPGLRSRILNEFPNKRVEKECFDWAVSHLEELKKRLSRRV